MEQRFSDRMGFTTPPAVQLDSMNEALRNSIWSFLLRTIPLPDYPFSIVDATQVIAFGFLKQPIDDVPGHPSQARGWLRDRFFQLPWYEVYNLVESIVEHASTVSKRHRDARSFIHDFNEILEAERSGYHFIGGQLAPISNEAETEAIKEALAKSNSTGLEGAHIHLTTSLKLFGQRPEPDYRNSIKEAISAVESAVKCIEGISDGGLDAALRKLSAKASKHPALTSAFLKLYGYTSDDDGIRHAILDQPIVGFDEAKFMLVACSAFVNFLIAKAEAASLLS